MYVVGYMSSDTENDEKSEASPKNTKSKSSHPPFDDSFVDENEVCKLEWVCFLFVILIIFPLVSLSLIGLYGFLVWMGQIFIFGPPGADDCGV